MVSVRTRLPVLALALSAAVVGLASPAHAAGNFARHLTLTVGAGVVGGPHANFPLLVQVISGDLITTPGGSVQSASGYDIVFRGEDDPTCGGAGTSPCMLDHEIEEYNGGAGILIAWVRVPSLAAGRVIHLYYGNPQITSPTSAAGAVFDANYVGVWHLNKTDTGGWNNQGDSSRYANHGTGGDSEAPAMTTPTIGKIGIGQNFGNADLTYDFIDAGEDTSLHVTGNQITLEAWLRHSIVPNTAHGCANPPHVPNCPAVPSVSSPYGIINHKGYYDGYRLFLVGDPFQCPNPNGGAFGLTAPCLGFSVPGVTDTLYSSQYGSPATDPMTSGTWHHAAATYDGTEMKMYVDGQPLLAIGGNFSGSRELMNGTCAPVDCGSVGVGGTTVTFDTPLPASVGAGHVLTFDARVGGNVENFLILSKPTATTVTVSPAAALNHVMATGSYRITSPFKSGNIAPSMAEQAVWIGQADQPQNVGWSSEWEGDLDEVRVSNVARSAGWIQTQYNNQNSPATFYAVGGPVGVALPLPTFTTVYRSIGTNAGVIYSTGTATVALNGTVVSFAGGASLPANVGPGDQLDFTGGPAETLFVLSRDSATQMTVQTPAASAHAGQTYTVKRAYNTLSAWETALPPSLVSANVREVGVAYADGPLSGVTFSGSVTDPVHNIVLTANTPARTRGTPGSGVVLDNGAAASSAIYVWDEDVTIERFEIKGGAAFGAPGIDIHDTAANQVVVRNCLIHDIQEDAIRISDANSIVDIYNNFVYNAVAGIRIIKDMSPNARVDIFNNTLYNNTTAGITSRDERDLGGTPVRQTSARVTLRNNIAHSNGVDFEVAKPFDEAYFCTGITGVNPTGCTSVTAALADPASNSVLGFTAADSCLYLGATDKFRGVAVTPLTPPSGSGADLQWDLWNGASWASLETGNFRDYNFEWPGFAYAADDPSGWATRTVGAAVAARYYVRACYAGSASSPTEKLIVRADVAVASRYNLAKDKTGLYNSLWRGVGETGIESPAGPIGAGVGFVSATDLHVQSTSAARDAVVNQSRADGNQVGGIQNPRFTTDFDLQLRPVFSCPGDCWDIGADEYVATTAVRLLSFDAVARDAAVDLVWQTGSELDNLGFHLYRGPSEDGPWTRLDSSLIPGLGSSATGKAYSYRDAGLQNGTRYFYRLEDVDASSKVTSHGPVSAVPTAGAAGGAPGGQPPTGSGGSAKKQGPASPSCPEWVLSAYASNTGANGATAALVCTRHGDPDAVSLQVVARDSRSATLELRTGGFYSLREASGSVRVFVPGFEFPSDAQAAALPFRRALVEAVVGRRVALGGVRATDQVAFPGLVPGALGKAEMQVSSDGTVRAGRRGVRAPALQGASTDLARLLPSVFLGETKSAVVEISPLRFDARRQQLLLAKRVRVRLLFSGRETAESGRGARGRKPRPDRPASGELLARLYATSRGLYAVSFEQLFPGGRRGILASELRLERQGEAHAFHIEPATGSFGPGGVLYFHADTEAASSDFSSETAFELVLSRTGVTMPLVSATPAGDALASVSRGFARFEANRFYQPGLLDAPDPWLWENLASGTTRTKSFSLTGVSAGAGKAAELEVFLQGASESGGAVDHHVSVSLNGTLAGEARFAGKQPYRMTLGVPASLLREGANELSLTNVADTGATSYVFLDRFTLSYPQASSLAGGRFEGTWNEAGTVTLGGLTAQAALLDVTATPTWLSRYETSGGTLRFRAEAGHRYLAVSAPGLLTPRVAAPTGSSLRATTNQADYLLIAPRAFLAAAEPLLERRRDQGLEARGVAFEEIAERFGHGQPSAEAIRSFLAYAFQSWARPSPRYVLLLGDSSYDPRNFIGTSPPSPLPALWTKTSYLWTASDPLLAAVNGDDALPDLAIGRLPAATVEEAQRLVAKLLAWEDSGQGLSGAAALVADNSDLGGDFETDVRDIAQSFLAGKDPQLLLLSELGAGARPAIQAALDSGLGSLSYVGHGGAAVWASENVWNSWDVASLQAQSRQPLLMTMNCLNGYFVAPAFDSLTESLLKADGRGAIAGFSPSGLSLDGPAHQYHRALMAELVSGRHERLGDALTAAQKAYAETGLMPELISVYHLFGDPATRIQP